MDASAATPGRQGGVVPASAVTRARPAEAFAWSAGGVCAAAAVGVATAVNPKLGVAVALGLIAAVAVVLRPKVVLLLAAASFFVEDVTISGVTVTRLIAPLALGVLLAVGTHRRSRLGGTSLIVSVGAYSLWALASISWTVSGGKTAFQIGSLAIAVVYMAAIALLIESQRDLKAVLLAIVVASALVGIFAVATVVLSISSQLVAGRPKGGAGDPNLFATYQLVALPLTLALAASTAVRSHRVLLLCAALVNVASILVSQSRGGFLALIAMMLVIVILPAGKIFRSGRQKAAVIAVAVLAAVGGLAVSGTSVVSRFQNLQANDPSASGRTYLWEAAWTSIKERPVLGLGFGSFPAANAQLLYDTPGVDFRRVQIGTLTTNEVHNVYLGSLAELGVPGLLLFVSILLATGRHLLRTARRARNAGASFVTRVATALLLSLLGWSAASIFLSTETSRSIWTLIGITLALPKLIPGNRPTNLDRHARDFATNTLADTRPKSSESLPQARPAAQRQ